MSKCTSWEENYLKVVWLERLRGVRLVMFIDIELLNLVWRKYSFATPSSDLGTCYRPTHWEKDSWRTVT
jgi:hypothetical protein